MPVLNALSQRQVVRLRALVVLPSRDLAEQVHSVFERYAKGSDLSVGLAIGQTDIALEQKALLIGDKKNWNNLDNYFSCLHALDPLNTEASLAVHSYQMSTSRPDPLKRLGGQSAVDILVCTPGRLMDHLENTPGFTLQHLRFLVIDEADRLLNQSYQNFISRVNDAVNNSTEEEDGKCKLQIAPDGMSYIFDPITHREAASQSIASDSMRFCRPISLRKMLFSATMTKDPQKLAALGLVHPKHFDVNDFRGPSEKSNHYIEQKNLQKYSIPSTLEEFVVECKEQQKPLVLIALVQELCTAIESNEQKIIVVFTKSIDSTHRLARLLQILWGSAGYGSTSEIAEYNGNIKQKHRQQILERCTEGKIKVLVCSDGMSRGMDLDIQAVIHYDVPNFAKTYVRKYFLMC